MITINFFENGVYIKGHDRNELCTLVSYAMYALTNDALLADDEKDKDITHYASAHDPTWGRLGFMYFEFDPANAAHKTIFDNFKGNLWYWVNEMYKDYIPVVDLPEEKIDWTKALLDAKKEQGYVLN